MVSKHKLHRAKRFLSMLLALLTVLTLFPVTVLATADYTGTWAESSIKRAVEMGWFADGNNTRPGASITRAEFVTMINRMKGYTGSADLSAFTDIKEDDWYYSAFSAAVAQGYIQGDNGMLNPNANITRYEAVAILVRVSKLDTSSDYSLVLANVIDADSIPNWARPYAGTAVYTGLIAGINGNFNGEANISRAETAVLLERLHDDIRVYGFAGTYTGESNSVVVAVPDVTLQNYSISGDLTIAASVGDGTVNLNNVTVNGTLDVQGGGINSVYISGCNIAYVIVTKDEVRVVFQDGTTATYANVVGGDSKIVIESGAKVENIVIESDAVSASVVVESGAEIGTMSIAAEDTTIDVAGTVTEITINANNTSIDGTGKVESIVVKGGSGTIVKTDGTKVTVSPDAGEVSTGDGKTISSGSSGDSKPDTSTSDGSSGGGGGIVGKSAGGTVSGEVTVASKTHNSITVNSTAATTTGQMIQYAISTSDTTAPTSDWQTGLTFSALSPDTDYYIWAQTVENSSYYAGTASKVGGPFRTSTIAANTVTVGDIVTSNAVAGTDVLITLTVKDSGGNADTSFNGAKNVTVSGYAQAPDNSYGSFNGTVLTSSTVTVLVNFTAGVAENIPLTLHKAGVEQNITFDVTGVVATRAIGTVSITPVAGAAASLQLTTPAVVPRRENDNAINLLTVPIVTLFDVYKNKCTDGVSSTATVILTTSVATGSAPQITGGSITATGGVATFTGAQIAAAVDVALFSFVYTAEGMTVSQSASYASVATYSVSVIPSYTSWNAEYGYTNTEKAQQFTVTNTGNTAFVDLAIALANTTSFTISGNTEADIATLSPGASATVTVTPKANLTVNNQIPYTNTLKVTSAANSIANKDAAISFTVTPKPVAGAQFTAIEDKDYTGSAITPLPAVTLDGTTLTAGTHFDFSYQNNTDAGTATIIATGKGNYTGTATTTFIIKPTRVTLSSGIVASTTASFTWEAAVGAGTVELHVSTTSGTTGFAKAAYTGTLTAGDTSVTATGLSANTTYWFKLVVTGGSFAGDSNVVTFATENDITNVTSGNYETIAGQNIVTITLTDGIFKTGTIGYSDFTFEGVNSAAFSSATFTRTSNTVVTITKLQLAAGSDNKVTVLAATLTKKATSVASSSSSLYNISGKIDAGTTGISVAGLFVTLYANDGTTVVATSGASDSSGNYTIFNVAPVTLAQGYKVMVQNYSATMSAAFEVANDITDKNIMLSLGTLSAPANVKWQDGSSGVATWDALTNATSYTVELYKGGSTKIDITNSTTTGNSMNLLENMHGGGIGEYTFRVTATAPGYEPSNPTTSTGSQSIAVLNTPTNVSYSNHTISWDEVAGVDYYVVKLYKAAYAASSDNSSSASISITYPNVASGTTSLQVPEADIQASGNYYVTVQAMAAVTGTPSRETTLYKDGVESGKSLVARVPGAVTMTVSQSGTGGIISGVEVGANTVNPNNQISILASSTMSGDTGYVLKSVSVTYDSNTWTYTYTASSGNWVLSGTEGFGVTITPEWNGKRIRFDVPGTATYQKGISVTLTFDVATAIKWKLSNAQTLDTGALVDPAGQNIEVAYGGTGYAYFILPGDLKTHNAVTLKDSSRDNLIYEITDVTSATHYKLTAVPSKYAHLETALKDVNAESGQIPEIIRLANDFAGTGNAIALTSDNAPSSRGLVIDGGNKTIDFGILVTTASNVTVQNLNITISDKTKLAMSGGGGNLGAAVFVDGTSTGNKFVDCNITHSQNLATGETNTLGQAVYIAGPIEIQGGTIKGSGGNLPYAVLIDKSIANVSIKGTQITGWTPLFITGEAATNFATLVPANFDNITFIKTAPDTAAVIVRDPPANTMNHVTDETPGNAITGGALSASYFTSAAIGVFNALRGTNASIDFTLGTSDNGVMVQLSYSASTWSCKEYKTAEALKTVTPHSATYYAGNGCLVITMQGDDMIADISTINLGVGDNQIQLWEDVNTPTIGLGSSEGNGGNYYSKATGFSEVVSETDSIGKWYWSGKTLVINIGKIGDSLATSGTNGSNTSNDATVFDGQAGDNWAGAYLVFYNWQSVSGYNNNIPVVAIKLALGYNTVSYSYSIP